MGKYRVDLHIHTVYSDGQATPTDIVDAAKRLGYEKIAITDHDGIAGLPEAIEEGRKAGITVVPGIELATETAEGTVLHILGYDIDIESARLKEAVRELSRRRQERNVRLIGLLREKGYEISQDELEEIQPGGYIGKPVIARALVEKGYAGSVFEVFQSEEFLGSPEALAITKEKMEANEAVKLIVSVGGMAVLAHPIQAKGIGEPGSEEFYENMESIISRLKESGLGGLECFHPDQNAEQSLRFVQIAEKLGLEITRGSDFHGENFEDAEDTADTEQTENIE